MKSLSRCAVIVECVVHHRVVGSSSVHGLLGGIGSYVAVRMVGVVVVLDQDVTNRRT